VLAVAGRVVLRQQSLQCIERFDERLVRRPEVSDAGAEQDSGSVRVEGGARLAQQPRFAGPWLAAEEDDVARARTDGLPRVLDHRQLAGAAGEARLSRAATSVRATVVASR
jgi:hypothetical protein